MEIIALMPNGKEVLKRVNLVSLGTPDFGFTEGRLAREMTISSSQDPISMFPKRNPKMIDRVKGHDIEDYLESPEVMEQIRRQFNYYSNTTYYQEVQKKKQRTNKKRNQSNTKSQSSKSIPSPSTPKSPESKSKVESDDSKSQDSKKPRKRKKIDSYQVGFELALMN